MDWSSDAEIEGEKEVRRLKERIPANHHQTLERVTLKRAQRLYEQAPLVLADELRRVRACIQPDESDFETLLEGAFVEVPEGFTFKPKLAELELDSKLLKHAASKNAYGVHAVNADELLRYFMHGGIIPHFRDGKWRIEVTPYTRCYVNEEGVKTATKPADKLYSYNERYADQHAFTGFLAANGIIRHIRDDHFGRQHLDKADKLYNECVKLFLENDSISRKALKELLVSSEGAEKGSKLFLSARGSRGVRIEFNEKIKNYFKPSKTNMGAYEENVKPVNEGAAVGGSIVLQYNHILPFDAVYSIHFNGGARQTREFRKLLAQPTTPTSIFRIYLK